MIVFLYFLSGIITIAAEHLGNDMIKYLSKLLLMPLLMYFLYKESKEVKAYLFIYLALFFSWFGDIFLMFPRDESSSNAKWLFIGGLVSFLIAHLNYSIHFIKEIKSKPKASIIVENPYMVLPFVIFVVVLLRLLYPGLGSMKVPVTVYAIIITTMAMVAFNRKNIISKRSFYLVFSGAVLFVFSDACIAINLFYQPFELARMLIMSTYILAQYLIIKGILSAKEGIA